MKKRLLILAIVLLCIINITALATLSYNRWIRPQPKDISTEDASAWEAMQIRIDLKPNQMQKMQGLRISLGEKVKALRQQMEEKRIDLIEEVRNPAPDLNKIDRVVDELSALQAEVQKKTIRNLIKDKQLLTPRQQERYFFMFEEHLHGRGRGQGRRGRGRGPRWLRENER
ncbi:MAG: periplasmic heavy metal sensor [Candidatus Aminicenantes bacterium]|jgi:Spy/CpxP family protein refolding chaperone